MCIVDRLSRSTSLPYTMRYDPAQDAKIQVIALFFFSILDVQRFRVELMLSQEYVVSFQALTSSGRLSCACPP
jgi:hypothetical protein